MSHGRELKENEGMASSWYYLSKSLLKNLPVWMHSSNGTTDSAMEETKVTRKKDLFWKILVELTEIF